MVKLGFVGMYLYHWTHIYCIMQGAEHRMALQKLKEEVADLKKVLQKKERELSSLRNTGNRSGNISISKVQ